MTARYFHYYNWCLTEYRYLFHMPSDSFVRNLYGCFASHETLWAMAPLPTRSCMAYGVRYVNMSVNMDLYDIHIHPLWGIRSEQVNWLINRWWCVIVMVMKFIQHAAMVTSYQPVRLIGSWHTWVINIHHWDVNGHHIIDHVRLVSSSSSTTIKCWVSPGVWEVWLWHMVKLNALIPWSWWGRWNWNAHGEVSWGDLRTHRRLWLFGTSWRNLHAVEPMVVQPRKATAA